MNCDRADSLMPMALYGELDDGDRHELELHLAECPRCSRECSELQRLRLLLSPPLVAGKEGDEEKGEEDRLLAHWRANLSAALDEEAGLPSPPAEHLSQSDRRASWWRWVPSAAFAGCIAVAFAAGWWMHRPAAPQSAIAVAAPAPEAGAPIRVENTPAGPQAEPVGPSDGNPDALLRVNSVERAPDGAVRIHFDTVEEHAVTGRSSDPRIRRMLLYAVQHPLNSGIRLDSLDLLGDQAQDKQVRQVLIRVLLHDPNPGVRLKALESLTPHMNRNAAVRQAIVHEVLHDANAGVRSQAVSALSQAPPSQAAPLLLHAGDQTGDFYLRLRIAAALRQMQASVPPRWLDARANPAVTSQ